MLLAIAMFVLGISGQAMAAFVQGDLIRVVYGINPGDSNKYEYATDLGSAIQAFSTPFTTNFKFTADPINFGVFGTAAKSDLMVAYYIWGNNGVNEVWASSNAATGQYNGSRKYGNFGSEALNNLINGYSPVAVGNNATLQVQPGDNSYNTLFGTSGNLGTYINLTGHPGTQTDKSLVATGYVDQWLFYYSPSQNTSTYGGGAGTPLALIRTYANGTTEINPSAVPIPAAVYLLGSGLLGLIGIRRRMMA